MEFCSNHSKILKTSCDSDKELPNIYVNKFLKESSIETIDNLKDQSFKISLDKNNNKHVLSPLGHSQGPRGIKVSRLSLQCSESSIRHSLIQQFGIQNKNSQNRNYNIKSIVLESAAGPSPTRWAIVTFVTSYDAEKALQMASKSQSVELHPGYDLFDFDELNITANCPQGLDEFHPKASRTLQISNLPQNLNNFKTLYEYFSKLGKVLDIEIKPKLVLHASALVQFSDISKVVKILVSPRSVLKCLVGSSITSSTSFQFGPSFPTNCIWLGQISNTINENQITEYFSRFGHVLEVVQDVKQQKALVYLDNAFAAQQSIIHLKRKNSFLGTCRVQIDYASLECQATISYWLSNNFITLPVPPDNMSLKQSQSDNSINSGIIYNRSISRINSYQEKLVVNINKSTSVNDQAVQIHSNGIQKPSDIQISLNSLSNFESINYTQPTISIKNYQSSIGNSGVNNSDMVITDRLQTDNATRVTPICNKKSSNIRITNPYDSSCDTTSNNRFSQNYDQLINSNSSHLSQPQIDYQNTGLCSLKKDRNYTEINDGKLVNNIRLSCSPVTWSTNTCTQSSEINKSDIYHRQFSPWSAPVRNRVVARVDPFTHTSTNTHNSSQSNSNIQSKTIQSLPFVNRNPSTITSHSANRTIQRSLTLFPEKDLNFNVKSENLISISKNALTNDREFGNIKHRTNYNQPLTYRVAKNPENVQKCFDVRAPLFTGVHKLKSSKTLNYKISDISENSTKQVTAAEVFGEDFSDLSDSDSPSSYISNSRKRKQNLSKCKSPSVDSSSTVSVLSSEKQNRFIRISKVHYHGNKKSIHLKPKRKIKNRISSGKFSSGNISSDEPLSEIHNSKMNRHKMKISMKEKSETVNSSMKPLTVNVSLSNFEDNPIDSDEMSSMATDNSSVELSTKCLNITKMQSQLSNSKRKLLTDKTCVYRNDNINMSSSSDNEVKDYRKYQGTSNRKSKSFINNHDECKRSNSYIIDRKFKENKFLSKVVGSRNHKTKFEKDHHNHHQHPKNKIIYNSHNFVSNKCKDSNDKSSYLSRNRQDTDSPPLKRKKLRHEENTKANIYRSSEKKIAADSCNLDLHPGYKRQEFQQISKGITSDAVFQKEFDEFKRDQAGDQSFIHRKGNSLKVSSASSSSMKPFSSYEKYKSQKPSKSSKINNIYTTSSDCKNIFQIDMNNINMFESMYDKVKRRAQKQAETKNVHNSPETNEPHNNRKCKMSEHKLKSLKESKRYYKRHKKSRELVTSPISTAYSDDSSLLVDDSQSNYSSTMYVASEKDLVRKNRNIHHRKMFKPTKNSTVSSFESPNSISASNWKRSRNKDEMARIFNYSNKSEMKYGNSKRIENEFENDNEDHENISEFSYKTNISNVNFPNKPIKEYRKNELEEVANISDATASTEPMEYAEVDLESLKMSDDDWKSGLSSQSSNESCNKAANIEIHNVNMSLENPIQIVNEKSVISEKNQPLNYTIETNGDCVREIIKDHEDKDISDDSKIEQINKSPHLAEHELTQINEVKDNDRTSVEEENQECVKEEQDIAIASIMLKEENDSKSPIDWKSNVINDSNSTINSINHIFDNSCDDISANCNNYDELALISTSSVNVNISNNEFSETIIPHTSVADGENSLIHSELTNTHTVDQEHIITSDKCAVNPTEEAIIEVASSETEKSVPVSQISKSLISPKAPESKSLIDNPACSNNEIISESISSVISASTRTINKVQSQNKNINSPIEKLDLTSYVKGVIEQVKREQSAENQNKLKLEKNTNKRIKKMGVSSNVSSKNSQSSNNSASSNLSMSVLTTLQKSPTLSLQASIIDSSDSQVPSSSYAQSITPNIPGVNVCSPVTSAHLSICKPSLESSITSLPEITIPKTNKTRSNVISIINMSTSSSIKSDRVSSNSPLSELKVNTELNQFPNNIELNSSASDPMSTQLSSVSLKSPLSEDHTKQRICTRLRRADPSKSDSNYKIVTTTCITRSDVNHNNNNNQSNSNISDNQLVSANKSLSKLIETVPLSELATSQSEKVSDPYEPNFDESPLEFSRYRTKIKNTFFPQEKPPKNVQISEENQNFTPVTMQNVTFSSLNPVSTSGIDSVSQIIEDVVHGNFNYSEYLTSFKNGKLSSFQVSPSTTPLTFVSNDSRDCSSVSVDNSNSTALETTSTTLRKSNLSKSVVTPVFPEDNKKDLFVTSNSISNINKSTVTLLTSMSTADIGAVCNIYTSNNKLNLQKEISNSNFVSKSSTLNANVSQMFTGSTMPQLNTEFLALINLCKPKDANSQKSNVINSHENVQQKSLSISAVQLQPCDSSSFSMDKNTVENSKLTLNIDSNLSQAISKNNLFNIAFNSPQSQSNGNSLLPPVSQNQNENAVKQLYFNLLQRSHFPGVNVDSLSKLQTAVTESSLNDINSHTDSNSYTNVQNSIQLESITALPLMSEANQESVNVNSSQNISARIIADRIIPRVYPLVWEGKLSLKNEEAKVALHFVHGNTELLNACMHLLIFSGSLQWNNTGSLKIVQRMRLDLSQLEGVQRRMQNANEFCIGLVLPGGDDINQWVKQSQILEEGFIKYMRDKGAAGIINVCHPENNQQGLYVVHIFPPCEFSINQLLSTAPDLQNIIEVNKFPNLLVVITTV